MQVRIQFLNDEGAVVHEHTAPAVNPTQWRTPPDKPLDLGQYLVYGYVWQPQVTLNQQWMAKKANR